MGSECPGSSDLGDRHKEDSVQGGAGHCCAGFAVGTSAPATSHVNSTNSKSQTLGSWAAGCAAAGGCPPTACPPGRARQPQHRLGWCQQRWSPSREQQERLVASLQGVSSWGQLELLQNPLPQACASVQPRAQGGNNGQHCCELQTPPCGGPHRIPGVLLQKPSIYVCLWVRSRQDARSPCIGLGPFRAIKSFLVLGRCHSSLAGSLGGCLAP